MAAPAFRWELVERAGEGASATVWRARDRETGAAAAVKVAHTGDGVLREAGLVARVDRRWGPALLDAGIVPAGLAEVAPGARYIALDWTVGRSLGEVLGGAPPDRERLCAIVAHAVGRALAELHEAGVRHGDVKPANIVLAATAPTRDAATSRGATLIDMGLAQGVSDEVARGGTPRYLAPEVLAGEPAGLESDLYAFGIVLAEILDRQVACAADPAEAFSHSRAPSSEPRRWAEALLASSPGGRPAASWIADRAARQLGLEEDPSDLASAREAMVKRAYLAVRKDDLGEGARPAEEIAGLARAWIEAACVLGAKLGQRGPRAVIEPLSALGRARWLVSLAGPAAASWTVDLGPEGELAERLVALARRVPPAAWSLDDLLGRADLRGASWDPGDGEERWTRLTRELARPAPDVRALAIAEECVARGAGPGTIAVDLGSALLRRAEIGRAWAAVANARGDEVCVIRAEIARRRGDRASALGSAREVLASGSGEFRDAARAILGRLAWDAGDLDGAARELEGARGAAAAEVFGLIAYAKGSYDEGLAAIAVALAEAREAGVSARLEATRGMIEHARGRANESLEAFGKAAELATREGATLEEATYRTGEAAAATDAGVIGRALSSSMRAALLWERLGRRAHAARALLSRASALSAIGATHAADEAAEEARALARDSGDPRAAAFARWAIAESRPQGDLRARAEVCAADRELAESSDEDRARSAARLLVWAPDAIDAVRIEATDRLAPRTSVACRWEWWGARAVSVSSDPAKSGAAHVIAALSSLTSSNAPLSSKGPALAAAVRIATETADGDAARRFEAARLTAARALHAGTPREHEATLANVGWARVAEAEKDDLSLSGAQIAQLESIVRSLATRDRLRPLLEQILDAMVLWVGVERGLLLLRAPDGKLVVRAARNLARRDLEGEQLALSMGIARRAMETGDTVVATDAFSTLGDMHASVHALKLRSVLAVPLAARGDTLGVVYLDDRVRKGAFGPRELAWVRLVASQAAMAIADARDQVLLKRAVRRAERASKELLSRLGEREAELEATRSELSFSRAEDATRFRYDAIAGRSAPMRAMLHIVDRVTASDVPVLLVGESGTGKELVARAVHANGPRAKRAFVGENCASVPESLLETTLFGHVKGAFTGASSTRAGLFDVAHEGTLFLDEIGEMPLSMQSKLLRVLQDGEVRAVGGERTRRVDVRVIGATHRDLEAMVIDGTFREDLFYRLNVVTVRVPPLRERADDIPLLVATFIQKHSPERPIKVTRAAMEKILAYPWPGNVRQLENEIRRAIVLADDRIDVSALSADIARGGPGAARGAGFGLRARVDALEGELVREALAKTGGNQTRAAELLGVSRFGLQKMMKRLNIDPAG